jgi:hypothetical protein
MGDTEGFKIQLPDLAEEANEVAANADKPFSLIGEYSSSEDEQEPVLDLPPPEIAIQSVATTGLPEYLKRKEKGGELSWHDGEETGLNAERRRREQEEEMSAKRLKVEQEFARKRILDAQQVETSMRQPGPNVGGVTMPKSVEAKKKSTVKDKEKAKRAIGQSTHARWKTEEEMKLRQEFD